MNQKIPLLAPYGSMQFLALAAKIGDNGKGAPTQCSEAKTQKR